MLVLVRAEGWLIGGVFVADGWCLFGLMVECVTGCSSSASGIFSSLVRDQRLGG